MTDRTDGPNGKTDYIWPATSTKQGFVWFTTSTVGKRGKVSSVPPSKGCVTSTGWSTDTCTTPGLTPGTAYAFTVTAQNGVGISPPSAPSQPASPAR